MKQPTTSQKKIWARKGIVEFVDNLNKKPLSVRFSWAVAFLLGKAVVYEEQPKPKMADLETYNVDDGTAGFKTKGDENK